MVDRKKNVDMSDTVFTHSSNLARESAGIRSHDKLKMPQQHHRNTRRDILTLDCERRAKNQIAACERSADSCYFCLPAPSSFVLTGTRSLLVSAERVAENPRS